MSTSSIVRICIWSFIAFVLIAILFLGIRGQAFTFGGINLGFSTTFQYTDDNEYTAGSAELSGAASASIQKIEIFWLSGNVNVQSYAESQITFSESASRTLEPHEDLRYRVKNGVLTIQYCASRNGLGTFTNMPNKALTIWVPRELALEAIKLENISSEVVFAGLSPGELSIETVSGSVLLTDMQARKLSLETISGSVNAAGAFGTIDIQSVSGSVTLALSRMPTALDAESVSGSYNVTLPEGSGFAARLDSVSGSLNCPFANMEGKRRAVYLGGGATLDFETVSGSVNLALGPARDLSPMPAASALPPPSEPDKPLGSGGRSF